MGIGATVLVIAVIFLIIQSRGGKKQLLPQSDTTKGYFTDDDGASWFVDDLTNVPPYDHNGKKAVRARMFIAGNGQKFIGWLEQYDDAAKKRIEGRLQANKGELPERELNTEVPQVKKPGGKTWIKTGINGPGQDYRQAMNPDPPDHDINAYKGPIHPNYGEK
jgi:hypothetical protein